MTASAIEHRRAFLHALQFLTIIPVRLNNDLSPHERGLSLLWYPAVGLLLGLLLAGLAKFLAGPFYLDAAMVLFAWVLLTGALHLDGLADCADALVGGLGDRERRLELLRDPLCGSMAVVALVIALVLKLAALAALAEAKLLTLIWLIPMLARACVLPLFTTTAYVREGGLGTSLVEDLPRAQIPWALGLAGVIALLALPVGAWLLLALTLLSLFLLVRSFSRSRLGGFTGDVAGALIELSELALLLALAWYLL
ncbi:MAG: adenosylcobinamide-GDP ribazoletransferase [Pseudomonadota bacterium]